MHYSNSIEREMVTAI